MRKNAAAVYAPSLDKQGGRTSGWRERWCHVSGGGLSETARRDAHRWREPAHAQQPQRMDQSITRTLSPSATHAPHKERAPKRTGGKIKIKDRSSHRDPFLGGWVGTPSIFRLILEVEQHQLLSGCWFWEQEGLGFLTDCDSNIGKFFINSSAAPRFLRPPLFDVHRRCSPPAWLTKILPLRRIRRDLLILISR